MDPAERMQQKAQRRETITALIPRWYSPVFHLGVPTLLVLSILIVAIGLLTPVRPVELLTVPATFLLGYGFEWRVHKDVLHRRMPLLGTIYVRHELQHHVVFTYDDMAMRSSRELWLVLMPAYAVVLVFATVLPVGIGLGYLFTANVGLLFLASAMAFFLGYEWVHMAYHLPQDSRVYQWVPLLFRLREHHRRHHDPRLMKRWNFNVTLPLFDIIHRTVWSPEREAERDARRRRKRGADALGAPANTAN